MKRFAYSIMGFIILMAIFIYLACTGAGTYTLITYAIGVCVIICVFPFRRCEEPKDSIIVEGRHQQTLQNLIDTYGTPDEIIVTDVTHGNEIDGAVLVYDNGDQHGKGCLVCNGTAIDKDSITDITFHNKYGTAFGLPDEFQMVISTNDESQPKIYVRAGNDIEMVKEIVAQMKSHLRL